MIFTIMKVFVYICVEMQTERHKKTSTLISQIMYRNPFHHVLYISKAFKTFAQYLF